MRRPGPKRRPGRLMPGAPPSGRMDVRRIVSGPFDVNVYVVREGDEALVVDASSGLDWATFGPRVKDALAGARVVRNYLTHCHTDHVGGVAKMAAFTNGAPALLHADEAEAVEKGDARLTLGAFLGMQQDAHPVERVREGDVLEVGGRAFEVLLVPGHSPAHTALWESESRTLLSGDVVFEGGSFGRVDFPGCDADKLVESLEKLARLDPEAFYPGHMRPVTRGARKAIEESLENARRML